MAETGIVRWFDDDKGYGFIRPDDGGEDVMFQRRDVVERGNPFIKEGRRATYEVFRGPKGREGRNVQLLSG